MREILADARLYLRPIQFIDTPIGRDGEVARLAGGLQWFAAYELIAVAAGQQTIRHVIPVSALNGVVTRLADVQGARVAELAARISAPRPPVRAGERVLRFDQPHVMAILNLTPDSFSDGGRHDGDPARAVEVAVGMTTEGAAIIDVGGESTRPGAPTVWEGDEIARVVPLIERLARTGTPISIDTRKAGVMEAALAAGAHIVNDVAALAYDERAVEVVARAGCPVILMHSADPKSGAGGAMQGGDSSLEVFDWLEARIDAVVAGGVDRDRIIVDPGIGFGKALGDNLAVLNGLSLLHGLGCPLLLGASRKRIIGALSNEAPVDRRLGGSLMLALKGVEQGAQIVRVHDVPESVQALKVWRGMRDAALVGRP